MHKNAQKCTKAMIHVRNLNRIQVMSYVYIATSVMRFVHKLAAVYNYTPWWFFMIHKSL